MNKWNRSEYDEKLSKWRIKNNKASINDVINEYCFKINKLLINAAKEGSNVTNLEIEIPDFQKRYGNIKISEKEFENLIKNFFDGCDVKVEKASKEKEYPRDILLNGETVFKGRYSIDIIKIEITVLN